MSASVIECLQRGVEVMSNVSIMPMWALARVQAFTAALLSVRPVLVLRDQMAFADYRVMGYWCRCSRGADDYRPVR